MILYNKELFNLCFDYPKRYWYRNLLNIPRYFRLLHYLIKHGYNEYATWSTYIWFVDVMKPILTNYLDNKHGCPVILDNDDRNLYETEYDFYVANEKAWNEILTKMVELLELMDVRNPKYDGAEYEKDWQKQDKEMAEAKDEFFKLFSKHFANLWN